MDRNQKIYMIYRMFGYDYLFYTVINFLFFTQTKGLSVGQVMYLTGFYAMFGFIFQIPVNFIIERIGLKRSMNIGMISWILHILIIIFTNNFFLFAIGEMLSALGTTFKTISEQQYIYQSLKQTGTRKEFAKFEGKSVSMFYVMEAVSALLVGMLFEVNNYIPIVLTLMFMLIALVLSLGFDDLKSEYKESKSSFKGYLRDFKRIFKSRRIKTIYLYVFLITSIVTLTLTLEKSFIANINISPVIYGVILSLFTMSIGIGSKLQYKFEEVTKRKTLTYIGFAITILIVLAGVINQIFIDINIYFTLIATIFIFVIHSILQGIYRMSVKRYMNHFTTSDIRGKILSIFYICEGIGKSLIMFISGYIIDNIGTNCTSISIGIIASILLVCILKFMKKYVGLDEEEYSPQDCYKS